MELKQKENGLVDARDLHKWLEIKTQYSKWVKRAVEHYGFIEQKEFYPYLTKINEGAGRPSEEYDFTVDGAKELCMYGNSPKASEVRKYLIRLSNQRENLELVTVKEAAFAVKVVNCLKYIDNQKESLKLHSESYIKNFDSSDKYVYAEFNKYRSKIVGWDKEKVNKAINEYVNSHSGHNRNVLLKSNMQTQLSVIDVGEAIRVAVLDILYSQNENEDMAHKFSILCKKLAKEMDIKGESKNNNNLFRDKEVVESVKDIKLVN